MVVTVKVSMDEKIYVDTMKLLQKLQHWIVARKVPPGIYSTIFWWVETVNQNSFDTEGHGTWAKSKRANYRNPPLGDPRTGVASGKLMRSLGHHPGGLGERNTSTGVFKSLLPYADSFKTGGVWIPDTDIRFNVSQRRYVPVTGRSRIFKSLFKAGRTYNIPSRPIFVPNAGEIQVLQQILTKWVSEYIKPGKDPYFRVIG